MAARTSDVWNPSFLITPCLATGPEEESEEDSPLEGRDPDTWHVGFKISWDIETPGLAIPLHQGDCYFMLGNEEHRAILMLCCLSVTSSGTYHCGPGHPSSPNSGIAPALGLGALRPLPQRGAQAPKVLGLHGVRGEQKKAMPGVHLPLSFPFLWKITCVLFFPEKQVSNENSNESYCPFWLTCYKAHAFKNTHWVLWAVVGDEQKKWVLFYRSS